MDARQHALLARQLIDECGGPEKIVLEGICRFKGTTWLYKFRDAASASFMPADVMADLEAYCGKPIYSRALVDARPAAEDVLNVWAEACEATESAAELQRIARLAQSHPGGPTPRMRMAIEAATLRLEAEARAVRACNERGSS